MSNPIAELIAAISDAKACAEAAVRAHGHTFAEDDFTDIVDALADLNGRVISIQNAIFDGEEASGLTARQAAIWFPAPV
jgi:hypothetical protein